MENKIKVSVIVAVYNAEHFLRQCLDSIAGQTLEEIEIICVNDGSTDSSPAILDEYARRDSRFRIYSKENEGLGGASARNTGLELAGGKYISILDSDDFFESDMLQKAFRRAEDTEADLVVFGGCEYDERNGNICKVNSILNEKALPEKDVFSYRDCQDQIYQISQGMAWNKLYRRTFLQRSHVRFQKVKYTDDAYFTFSHMVLAGRIAVVNEPLCYYRVNSGVSQTDGLADYPDSSYIPYITLKSSLKEWGIYDDVKQSFVNCAAAFLRYFYDKINRFEPFQYLHNRFREEIFRALDISGQREDYFYDKRLFMWYSHVMEYTAGEMAFRCARAYGSGNATGILRFEFPYKQIPRDSRIVLAGAGIMGRYYYTQLVLSGHCNVVLWAEWENPSQLNYIHSYDEVKKAEFDYALVAYVQPGLIEKAVSFLKKTGIPDYKIILGAEDYEITETYENHRD